MKTKARAIASALNREIIDDRDDLDLNVIKTVVRTFDGRMLGRGRKLT